MTLENLRILGALVLLIIQRKARDMYKMQSVRYVCLRGLQLAVVCFAVITVTDASEQLLSGAALLESLQRGGYVLVMRHASSPVTLPDKSAAEPDNIKLERQLDETGRDTSRAMGKAIKELHIPIGDIWSSRTYRALQTIRLAGLGTPKTVPELGEPSQGMRTDANVTRPAWLLRAVTLPPRTGTNTLIVTHLPNIIAAFGQQAGSIVDGETLVFRPGENGSTALVARIKIGDWSRL